VAVSPCAIFVARAEEEIQTITDKYIAEIDQTLAEKESELMEV
jgi:ribosome recycling factor